MRRRPLERALSKRLDAASGVYVLCGPSGEAVSEEALDMAPDVLPRDEAAAPVISLRWCQFQFAELTGIRKVGGLARAGRACRPFWTLCWTPQSSFCGSSGGMNGMQSTSEPCSAAPDLGSSWVREQSLQRCRMTLSICERSSCGAAARQTLGAGPAECDTQEGLQGLSGPGRPGARDAGGQRGGSAPGRGRATSPGRSL